MDIKSATKANLSSNAFLQYLLTTTLRPSLHKPCIQPLLTVQATDSLSYVFRRLSREGVLSAPVLDGIAYRGFVTLFDIVNFVTSMWWGSTGEEWSHMFENHDEWKNATIMEIMETELWINQQNAEPLFEDNTTFHALEKLAICGAHRAAVLRNFGSDTVTNIMTQSMLISEVKQRMWMLGALRNRKCAEMTDFWQEVKSVKETSIAINAFRLMRDSNCQGLAVVDENGILKGSISVRDLRAIGLDGPFFSRLFRSVKEFKDTARKEFPLLGPRAHYYTGSTPLTGLCVTPESTFADVITKMADGCIHRVFVCSEESVAEGRPVCDNVITQTDVLYFLLRHFAHPAGERLVQGRG